MPLTRRGDKLRIASKVRGASSSNRSSMAEAPSSRMEMRVLRGIGLGLFPRVLEPAFETRAVVSDTSGSDAAGDQEISGETAHLRAAGAASVTPNSRSPLFVHRAMPARLLLAH